MNQEIQIIVSFYSARPPNNLYQLLGNLQEIHHAVLVVINDENHKGPPQNAMLAGVRCVLRENIGMNIGAWHEGFKTEPDKDFYLFLQDECFLKRTDIVNACVRRFSNEPQLGMLGETLNQKWNHSWEALRGSHLNWRDNDHMVDGISVPRVDFYLQEFKRLGVDPGNCGLHLRSLFWAFRGDALRAIGGFTQGNNKGECIAAEIAVSRKILQFGFDFDQLETQPFTYVGHPEWKADGSSKK